MHGRGLILTVLDETDRMAAVPCWTEGWLLSHGCLTIDICYWDLKWWSILSGDRHLVTIYLPLDHPCIDASLGTLNPPYIQVLHGGDYLVVYCCVWIESLLTVSECGKTPSTIEQSQKFFIVPSYSPLLGKTIGHYHGSVRMSHDGEISILVFGMQHSLGYMCWHFWVTNWLWKLSVGGEFGG